MTAIITNTTRPGETPEQIAARTAPRGMLTIPYPVHVAKLAYLTQPVPGRFVLNLQIEGHLTGMRFEISRAQIGNMVADGAAMVIQENQRESVRLGPESFAPVVPDAEAIEIAQATAALGEELA